MTAPIDLAAIRLWLKSQALFDVPEAAQCLAILSRLEAAEKVVEAASEWQAYDDNDDQERLRLIAAYDAISCTSHPASAEKGTT